MEEKAREQRRTDKSESGTLFKKSSFSRPSIHFFLKKRIEVSVGSVLLYSVLRLYIYIYIYIFQSERHRSDLLGTNIYPFDLDYQRFTPHLLSGWIRSVSSDKGGMFSS